MQIKKIIVHYSASPINTTVQEIDGWHKERWSNFRSSLGYWSGYHYIITSDGKITQTRQDNEMGAHAIPNDGRLGICVTGFMPTSKQCEALAITLDLLKEKHGLTNMDILGHDEVSRTECPGAELKKWLNLYKQLSILQRMVKLFTLLFKGRKN